MVQTEVGARENLRLAMVNSAVGDTRVTVTLGTSGSQPQSSGSFCKCQGGTWDQLVENPVEIAIISVRFLQISAGLERG